MARLRKVVLLGCLVGCQVQQQAKPDALVTAKTKARTPMAETAALRMQVVLRGSADGAARAVAHRTQLPVGAHVGLRLETEGAGPLWLYPYHRASDGKLEPLSTEPARVAPGVVYELPAGGLWYELVATVSAPASHTLPKENFYVLASRTPLGARLANALAELPDEREPPPISDATNRFPGPVYRRALDSSGMAILLVSLLQTAASR